MPTPSSVQLASGLAGAIGSHFHGASNRLYFVEYGGKLSRFDFVRAQTGVLLNAASVTHKGTWYVDLDTGAVNVNASGDIWWNQQTAVKRRMAPVNGAQLAYLGVMTPAAFNALTATDLQALSYGSTEIVGDDNASNQLVAGAVFAVRTNAGNVSKVRVLTYGYNLKLSVSTFQLAPAYKVLGTGYGEPEDVKVSADGKTAYITERGGRLLRVALNAATPPNRSAATVVASGLTAPHQIALVESQGVAYVVEYAALGHLVRVDLASGTKTNIAFNLDHAIGLVVTGDQQYAYVSEQAAGGGRVRRVTLGSGAVEPVAGGFTAPFMLAFNDASESAVLVAERDPANRVSLIDLGVRPIATRQIAPSVPFRPSSVALVSGSKLLVCSNDALTALDLAGAALSGSGPLLLGVGLIPVTKIAGGYADTSDDAGYLLVVKDCPFGGTLPIMFNHERARLLGAKYYRVLIDGAATTAPFGDYRWSSADNAFKYVPIVPDAAGFYPVRSAGELWYNAWLGLARDTGDLSPGLHTFEVRVYNAAHADITPSGVIRSTQLMIDNQRPLARINTILQGNTVASSVPVGACAIVNSGPDAFFFDITASDSQQHLLSWHLYALWGDNKSASIASDRYGNHVSASKQWAGVNGTVPGAAWHAAAANDATSTRCAHTFVLEVWDRVINGYGYIHAASAHKSITIWL